MIRTMDIIQYLIDEMISDDIDSTLRSNALLHYYNKSNNDQKRTIDNVLIHLSGSNLGSIIKKIRG